jgi:uncharacterized protein YcnI
MKRTVALLAALFALALGSVASAHVTVWPKQSPVNGYERYTVRVPTEKDIPTTKVRVELPAGSTFSGWLPVPGWTLTTEKDGAGKVVALVFAGGQIKPGEFMEFGVSVKNPGTAADVAWKAYQTYSDNSVVEWVGPSTADKPAPTVTLTPATGAAEGGNAAAPGTAAPGTTAPAPAPAPAVAPAAAPASGAGNWLGGGALVISLVALVLAIRKR